MSESIRGVLPVVQTPFDEREQIDFDTLHREVDFAFACGAQGIVMALASEILRLTFHERCEMARRLVQFAEGQHDRRSLRSQPARGKIRGDERGHDLAQRPGGWPQDGA